MVEEVSCDAVRTICVPVIAVIAQFVNDKHIDQQRTRHRHGEPGNVDECCKLVSKNASDGGFDVVADHNGRLMLMNLANFEPEYYTRLSMIEHMAKIGLSKVGQKCAEMDGWEV